MEENFVPSLMDLFLTETTVTYANLPTVTWSVTFVCSVSASLHSFQSPKLFEIPNYLLCICFLTLSSLFFPTWKWNLAVWIQSTDLYRKTDPHVPISLWCYLNTDVQSRVAGKTLLGLMLQQAVLKTNNRYHCLLRRELAWFLKGVATEAGLWVGQEA